eukprot:TRINITY_DN2580_c0_g3_i1.p1 TRINITY_DN2580_c0_g3~~TRINITY_DN2580_c0_g3_i1.p1  ORF type:complete len:553 (-),score=227.68 TRINITY_DN2580_c0_g3_i1:38-1696(-)
MDSFQYSEGNSVTFSNRVAEIPEGYSLVPNPELFLEELSDVNESHDLDGKRKEFPFQSNGSFSNLNGRVQISPVFSTEGHSSRYQVRSRWKLVPDNNLHFKDVKEEGDSENYSFERRVTEEIVRLRNRLAEQKIRFSQSSSSTKREEETISETTITSNYSNFENSPRKVEYEEELHRTREEFRRQIEERERESKEFRLKYQNETQDLLKKLHQAEEKENYWKNLYQQHVCPTVGKSEEKGSEDLQEKIYALEIERDELSLKYEEKQEVLKKKWEEELRKKWKEENKEKDKKNGDILNKFDEKIELLKLNQQKKTSQLEFKNKELMEELEKEKKEKGSISVQNNKLQRAILELKPRIDSPSQAGKRLAESEQLVTSLRNENKELRERIRLLRPKQRDEKREDDNRNRNPDPNSLDESHEDDPLDSSNRSDLLNPTEGDEVSQELARVIRNNPDVKRSIPQNLTRLEKGLYRIYNKDVNVDVINHEVVVRIGGGYQKFVDYVKRKSAKEKGMKEMEEVKKEKESLGQVPDHLHSITVFPVDVSKNSPKTPKWKN